MNIFDIGLGLVVVTGLIIAKCANKPEADKLAVKMLMWFIVYILIAVTFR